jgi:hypothetical protein
LNPPGRSCLRNPSSSRVWIHRKPLPSALDVYVWWPATRHGVTRDDYSRAGQPRNSTVTQKTNDLY